jgi:hypothetical protein
MAGRPGASTIKARELIEKGHDVAYACAKSGASMSGIYGSAWYRARLAAAGVTPRERDVCDATRKARALIEAGKSVPAACKTAGLSTSTIYRSAWYKARAHA